MHRPRTLDTRKGAALPDSFTEDSLPGRFSLAARRFAGRPALDDGTTRWSYGELAAESDNLARSISRYAGGREAPVCLLIDQSADLILAILAVLKSGRAYVALDSSDPPGAIRTVVSDAGAVLLICGRSSRELADLAAPPGTRCLGIDDLKGGGEQPAGEPDISPDDDAYIYYTSGTTGAPKGVVDVHRNVLHNVLRYTNSLAIDHDDRLSLIQSSNFSGTVSTIFCALLNGAALFPFDFRRRGVARLARWINENRITVFHSVPLIFEQLMDTGVVFPTIRLIRLEGDRMLPRHLALFKQRFGKDCVLVNGLASTETGLIRQNFLTPQSDNSAAVVPVGYPVKDMEVAIRLADGSTAAETEIGEIVVGSPFLAKGYWRRPDLTAASFAGRQGQPGRWYRTGDLGRLLPDGCLEHLGRGDSVTKIRGRFADLAAIEKALCELPQVRQALVKADESVAGGQLVAYVVGDKNIDACVSDLRAALSGTLPGWLVPAHFVFLDALPVDRHGKVARHLLPERSQKRPQLALSYRAPKSLMERQLADCFAEVLQIRPVGIHDSFFDLGGDSLSATALSYEIEKKFEVLLSPELVFGSPTVATLQSHLRDHKLVATAYPIRSAGSLAPLFCVHVYHHFASGYRRLAEHLSDEQPVYVLRDCPPLVSVEEIASAYLHAMQTVQPHGPYRICGNCFSGTVAYEMARQLQQKGETVEFLGLLDSAFPPRRAASSEYAAAVALTSRWRHLSRSRLAKLAIMLRAPVFRRWLKLHHAVEIAESRYRPGPTSGTAVLFVIGNLDNQAGWRDLLGDRLAIVRIAGATLPDASHRPHLTDAPYAAAVAEALAPYLLARETATG